MSAAPVALHVRGIFLPDEVERDVWIVAGHLTFDRVSGAQTVSSRGWILPGLVDAHCHIGMAPDGWVSDPAGLAEQASINRDAGALLLRDAGSPVDNRSLQADPAAPRLIRAGRHIARPRRYIRDLAVEVEPADLIAEVTRQVAAGDGWVKLVGDWIDRSAGERADLAPLWSDADLASAVTEAHRLGARVAIHAFGEAAVANAVRAGVDSIEHGPGLTDDLISEVVAREIALVPTLINIDTFPAIAARGLPKFPVYAAHMQALFESSRQRIRNAYEAGVAIYLGTDAGGSLPHGLVRDEIKALAAAGIPPAEVIAQSSWRAREWLGYPGLVEGAPADFIVYDQDPRADLATLFAPVRTVLRGQLVG